MTEKSGIATAVGYVVAGAIICVCLTTVVGPCCMSMELPDTRQHKERMRELELRTKEAERHTLLLQELDRTERQLDSLKKTLPAESPK